MIHQTAEDMEKLEARELQDKKTVKFTDKLTRDGVWIATTSTAVNVTSTYLVLWGKYQGLWTRTATSTEVKTTKDRISPKFRYKNVSLGHALRFNDPFVKSLIKEIEMGIQKMSDPGPNGYKRIAYSLARKRVREALSKVPEDMLKLIRRKKIQKKAVFASLLWAGSEAGLTLSEIETIFEGVDAARVWDFKKKKIQKVVKLKDPYLIYMYLAKDLGPWMANLTKKQKKRFRKLIKQTQFWYPVDYDAYLTNRIFRDVPANPLIVNTIRHLINNDVDDARLLAAWSKTHDDYRNISIVRDIIQRRDLPGETFDDRMRNIKRMTTQELIDTHNEANYRRLEDAAANLSKSIPEENYRFNDMAASSYEVDGYTITHLKDSNELIEEGKKMHHCVGGYSKRCTRGHSIWAIRGKEKKDNATLELSPDFKLLQLYGYCNTPVSTEINKLAMKVTKMISHDNQDWSIQF